MTNICPHCGAAHAPHTRFCPTTGSPLTGNQNNSQPVVEPLSLPKFLTVFVPEGRRENSPAIHCWEASLLKPGSAVGTAEISSVSAVWTMPGSIVPTGLG